MSYAALKILLLSSYHYLIRVHFFFRIRNAQQINALRQVCNGNFISTLNGLHSLPEGIVHLHFGNFNAFNYYSIPYRIGIKGYFRIFVFLNGIIRIGACVVFRVLPNEFPVLMEAQQAMPPVINTVISAP